MKTSSKLLIILGMVLFIVPITILSFTVTRGRVDYSDYQQDIEREQSTLGTEDVYLQTTALKPFHTVLVSGEGENNHIKLIIVKSDQYALKSEKGQALHMTDADDNGVLTLYGGKTTDHYQATYYLFTPAVHKLNLQNVVVQTKIDADTLVVHGDHVFGFNILPGSNVKNLQVRASHSNIRLGTKEREEASKLILEDVLLSLDSSQLLVENGDWKRIDLTVKNAHVNFSNKDKNGQLGELKLVTEGANTIRLDSLAVGKLSGKISDQTVIDLPISQLRPLIGSR